ncbi:MAG: ferrous iron transporter B [Lachnospiraceae bacterium]|nr:ferrous iron transporter B [Lachnospiraceae bacterium]
MSITIALAGNPNSGKTTLFNALTGSNQFVGNWPGVTVEKKEGRLKGQKDVSIMDLPGIYSLSPYTLEEVVARNYLISERPDAILNIVDGTNLERNLYLTTQLMELGIPVVMAVNMIDMVEKSGDQIHLDKLSKKLGCEVVAISALKGTGVQEAAAKAVQAAKRKSQTPVHEFAAAVESVISTVSDKLGAEIPEEQKRFFAIKLLEKDTKITEKMQQVPDVSEEIRQLEDEFDDDTESIITNERYEYIASIIGVCLTKQKKGSMTTSDKIDRIVTNRFLALPIFAVIMWLVYYVSVTTVGGIATDWANDGVFGDGWHLTGGSAYEEAAEEYGDAETVIAAFIEQAAENGTDTEVLEAAMDTEDEAFDATAAAAAVEEFAATIAETDSVTYLIEDEETLATEEVTSTGAELAEAVEVYASYGCAEPDPADYGIWIVGIPVLIGNALEAVNCADWLQGLILDGIVAGCGAVLGFVPQMLVLFIFLAFLESCGYMARIAFIMDRIFRRFGLSGKSFIPILIGTGCGVPGIMASRTIENDRDRKMTIITTTFIPCGAKLPFIAMVAGAIFGGASWVAPSAYFLGIAAIICSGIILKKTKLFAGDPAPFVMELPAYHMPTVGNVLRSMWERGWSFIKKAGTIILLSTIIVWFTSYFGFVDGAFTMLEEDQLDHSILAAIGNAVAWIFIPLGWGNWQAAVASVTGLVAKENIVGTMGILYSAGDGTVYQNMAATFTLISGYSFLAFNLLCAPCFAAMGAIKREMNNRKWFWVAVGYQCGFAYLVALVVYQLGNLITGQGFGIFTLVAIAVVVLFFYLLFRPNPEEKKTYGTARAAAK